MLDPRIYRTHYSVECTQKEAKLIHTILKPMGLVYNLYFNYDFASPKSIKNFTFIFGKPLKWGTGDYSEKMEFDEFYSILMGITSNNNSNIIRLKVKSNKRKIKVLEF